MPNQDNEETIEIESKAEKCLLVILLVILDSLVGLDFVLFQIRQEVEVFGAPVKDIRLIRKGGFSKGYKCLCLFIYLSYSYLFLPF